MIINQCSRSTLKKDGNKMKTIDKIITKVDTSRGAPMGRPNVDNRTPFAPTGTFLDNIINLGRLYDCAVPMSNDGAYDKGGAYWGLGKQLRVTYTKDLTYIEFYRK